MKFRRTNRQHDQLARRLRKAAVGSAPEFSEALHTKIMAGIRQELAGNRTGGVFPYGRRWTALKLLAATAVLLVVVGGWWFGAGFSKKTDVSYPDRRTPAVVGAGGAEALYPGWLIKTLAQLTQEKLEHARYAHLNQDARNLASFLTGELDIAPHLGMRHRRKVGIRTRELLVRRAYG